MFILFDERCRKCPKAREADTGPEPPADRGQYPCACPKCYAPVILRSEPGAATITGWAVRTTAVGSTSVC